MLGRFCLSVGKGMKGKAQLGRMSAETLSDTLKKELETEVKIEGWDTVKDKLMLEAIALDDLSWQEKQIQQIVKERFLVPTLNRSKEGYSVRGMFWQQTQEQMDEQLIQERLNEIREKIDWANTRQKILKEIEVSYSPIDTYRF